ncbi:hypothetical protein FQR65_LT05804 [Abscondita terminalis]|nr:hypothetical protein FQR65_LT05804 [Abscondita terminalis]
MLSKTIRQFSTYIPKGRLNGKVAVVTASTDGIGFAIAKRLAQEGAKVVISSRKQANVDKALSTLAAEGLSSNVVATVCNVSKAEDRKIMFDKVKSLGGLDILISNAAANPEVGPVKFFKCSERAWDKTFDTNVKAAYLLAKEALPLLRERGGGRIMFVSSIGAYQPLSILGVYSITKTALLGLTKNVAHDLATENITITQDSSTAEQALSQIPMRKFGHVNDIAGVAAFLASDDANYITGETIVAAGGMVSHL